MIVEEITLFNYRAYKGLNKVDFTSKDRKTINLVAGRNGYGKTTFLTSLIWCFYGKLMAHVEEKYRKEIRNAGGYEKYLENSLNRDVKLKEGEHLFSVKVVLSDIFIPTIPCRAITIERVYNLESKKEELYILIDGDENELTKEVGYEVFINDFILPREIAKFFFFDAEKIVSLAEAKTANELKALSKAYSEVLGIKKYEDLKSGLQSILSKLRSRGGTKVQQEELFKHQDRETNLQKQMEYSIEKLEALEQNTALLRQQSDSLQEKLIREGNSITLDELKELKNKHNELQEDSKRIRFSLKSLLELAPFAIAGNRLKSLHERVNSEYRAHQSGVENKALVKELEQFKNLVLKHEGLLKLHKKNQADVKAVMEELIDNKVSKDLVGENTTKVLLEFSEEETRKFNAFFSNIYGGYQETLKNIIQEEKGNRSLLTRTANKIKGSEAKKNNPLVAQYREEKIQIDQKAAELELTKSKLREELGALKNELNSQKKICAEYEKKLNLVQEDRQKFNTTQELLTKVNALIVKIKEEKKFSLQRSIRKGLKNLMHKEDFVSEVRVNIQEDIMDVDLIDKKNNPINKDALSKGEQQLYATALLKALVDESGIRFPVFIDSPLQKFDKVHSKNIIKEFYPTISDQVVLLPLLEKELTEGEYKGLEAHVNRVFLIKNGINGSSLQEVNKTTLFQDLKKEEDVYAH